MICASASSVSASASSPAHFGARTSIALLAAAVGAALLLLAPAGALGQQQQQQQDNCKIECYPNARLINGKGAGARGGENCRWILRTDGKPARLCDHIKCRKVCPAGGAGGAPSDQLEAASSASSSDSSVRFEQRAVDEAGAFQAPQEPQQQQQQQPMGIMRHLHGSKIAKAPVAGVQGGRLAAGSGSGAGSGTGAVGGVARRMAPTLPPAVQYDENDTPPPISRFLDISPEE